MDVELSLPLKPTMPEGISEAPSVIKDKPQPPKLITGTPPPLSEASQAFGIFHPFLLYQVVKQAIDPVWQFYANNSIASRPLLVKADYKIIHGLNPPIDREFILVPKEAWKGLLPYLCQATYVDRSSKEYWSMLGQEIPISDPFKPGATVKVVFFGIDGNKACYHFKPNLVQTPGLVTVSLVKDKPQQETVLLADLVLSGHQRPIHEVNDRLRDQSS
jgi:hypothetical protein